MIYLNLKTAYGIETVDCIDEKEFNSYKEYRKELKRLLNEYRLCSDYYSNIYTSQRSTKNFKK